MLRKNHNQQRKTAAQRLIAIAKILAIFAAIAFVAWSVAKFKDADFFENKVQWQIDKSLPIAQSVLEKSIKPLVDGKYLLDLEQIKQVLESQPWVAEADIKRLFFNVILINIKAHKINMRWENSACKKAQSHNCWGYISDNGTLFTPQKKVKSTATLAHSKSGKNITSELYQQYQNYQKIAGKMQIKSISKTHIDTLIITPNIKVVLGYRQQQKRLKRFLKAYKKLRKTIAKTKLNQATFDMRYPKGFALRL
ncbi:MAG: FtsQ-type POTRA domain-containing protein [Candidatus Thioglobus sp.]|nr:MAG: FtsQ-type POTRA domain-containing protein [Candidatus Thioglobus sp.]